MFYQEYDKVILPGLPSIWQATPMTRKADGRVFACLPIPMQGMTPERQQALEREANVLTRVKHPNVASYKAVFREADTLYALIDFLGVGTVAEYVERQREKNEHLPEKVLWCIAAQLVDCAAYLHSMFKANAEGVHRVYHMHVCPENVVIDPRGMVYLIDFQGIRILRDEKHRERLSSKPHVAPELRDPTVQPTDKADIWGIGATILHLATHETIDSYDPRTLDDFSSEFRTFLGVLCAQNPTERPSASDLLQYPQIVASMKRVAKVRDAAQKAENDPYQREAFIEVKEKTALMRAIEANDCVTVIKRLNYEGKVRVEGSGETALQLALGAGALHIAKLLTPLEGLKTAVTPQMSMRTLRKTELMHAAEAGDIVAVWHLYSAQAGISDVSGRTALMYAAETGHVAVVRMLLAREARAQLRRTGATALMLSIANNHGLVARLLVEKESALQDANGETALMYALRTGDSSLIQVLAVKEARIANLAGDTALHLAVKMLADPTAYAVDTKVLLEAVQALGPREARMFNREGMTALMLAAKYDLVEVVKVLHDYEAQLRTPQGRTALMFASESGATNSIPLLIDREACLVSFDGTCAFKLAALTGHGAVCKLLYTAEGPLLDTTFGLSFISLAATINNASYVHKYKEHFVRKRDHEGITALMYAAACNSLATIRLLLDDEAGLTRNDGATALSMSLRAGSYEAAEVLTPYEATAPDTTHVSGRKTDLMRAAEADDIITVWCLVGKQAKETDMTGRTALMHASAAGHLDSVRILAPHEAGIQVRAKNKYHCMNALMFALEAGQKDVVSFLSMLEAEREQVDASGNTVLMRAVRLHAEYALLKLGHALAGRRNALGLSALDIAATDGYLPGIHALQAHEGGLTDDTGTTALMRATQSGHLTIVELLRKEAGAARKDGTTALMLAASRGDAEAVKLLQFKESGRARSDGITALMLAAESGYADVVALLLNESKAKSDKGWTALMMAAQGGHTECVALLHDREAGAADPLGWTALIWAASRGHLAAVNLLKETEAGGRRTSGGTALMAAAEKGHLNVCKALFELEVGLVDNDGRTATMQAATAGHASIVSLLAASEKGFRDTLQQTALILAVQADQVETARILLPLENDLYDLYRKPASSYAKSPEMQALFANV
ncbi:Kinase, NEK [Giardia muris]|uniref:Kinase, NEK n=1 Tax=Giardia muris TaxID=5742 RepID=A0A4Z1ST58_GIAMU|nr:Kinase, NEK [Giardia muris]|eukprot:TNJ26838.1 Kinase, NEK [Giardia muris]